jgi:hypothetical protein
VAKVQSAVEPLNETKMLTYDTSENEYNSEILAASLTYESSMIEQRYTLG